MDRDLLPHLPVVLAVARHRGFAAAAAALGMSASAVSHAVRTVEDRLGQPLFARTTRSVAVTEAGHRFLAAVGPAFDDVARAFESFEADRGAVTGLLRISASRVAAVLGLTPILTRLAAAHPGLTVEVQMEDAFVDIIARGFDAGIRLGEAVHQDMTIARLTPPFRAIMVAAPAYVAAHGAPMRVEDLATQNCIGFRMLGSGGLYEWDLRADGRDVRVPVRGSVVVTDATYAPHLARAGVGIAYVFEPLVADDLAAGRLVEILPEASITEDGLFLYYPRRASLAPKLRAFVAAAREAIKARG